MLSWIFSLLCLCSLLSSLSRLFSSLSLGFLRSALSFSFFCLSFLLSLHSFALFLLHWSLSKKRALWAEWLKQQHFRDGARREKVAKAGCARTELARSKRDARCCILKCSTRRHIAADGVYSLQRKKVHAVLSWCLL